MLRVYVPDRGRNLTGGVGLPKPTLKLADGTKLKGQALCNALDSESKALGYVRVPDPNALLISEDAYAGDALPERADRAGRRLRRPDVGAARGPAHLPGRAQGRVAGPVRPPLPAAAVDRRRRARAPTRSRRSAARPAASSRTCTTPTCGRRSTASSARSPSSAASCRRRRRPTAASGRLGARPGALRELLHERGARDHEGHRLRLRRADPDQPQAHVHDRRQPQVGPPGLGPPGLREGLDRVEQERRRLPGSRLRLVPDPQHAAQPQLPARDPAHLPSGRREAGRRPLPAGSEVLRATRERSTARRPAAADAGYNY